MEPTYNDCLLLISQIKQTNIELFKVDQSIDTIEGKLSAEINSIETAIAYNNSLKNEATRKIARYEMQQASPLFRQWSEDLADQKLEKQDLRNKLEELRSTLSAMQLEIRRSVVVQETANLERIELQ
jgi:predicted  nucleic acid-binding Zn-ribbon protein